MINRSFFLLTLLLLASPVQASVVDIPHNEFTSNTYTHTPIELKPFSFENSYKIAAVCFMGFGDCPQGGFNKGNEDYSKDTEIQCQNEGFTKQNCNSVQITDQTCPYNSNYGKGCKCSPNLVTCSEGQAGMGESCGGKYASCGCATDLKTCASNEVGIGTSCGGKYQSCTCKAEYQFTSSNCSYPRSVSGSSCGGKYTNCSCPAGVSTGSYGCQEYYPTPCNSVCKIAKGDNCDKRTEVQTPYGCMSYFADCPSKCERAYTDNCRNRTAVTCQFGCTSYFADCQSKCQSCSSDNCANRTAVTVPNHAACNQYFSDCSSKCSAWTCKSGYTDVGGWCQTNNPEIIVSEFTNGKCSGGPYSSVSFRKPDGSTGYFPRYSCIDDSMSSTRMTLPLNTTITISAYSEWDYSGNNSLCKFTKSSPYLSNEAVSSRSYTFTIGADSASRFIIWGNQYGSCF